MLLFQADAASLVKLVEAYESGGSYQPQNRLPHDFGNPHP
jgi:hypothetical protein